MGVSESDNADSESSFDGVAEVVSVGVEETVNELVVVSSGVRVVETLSVNALVVVDEWDALSVSLMFTLRVPSVTLSLRLVDPDTVVVLVTVALARESVRLGVSLSDAERLALRP